MIQMNLLPDVKLEYIKAQRMRRLVLVVSVLVTIVSVGLLVLTLMFNVYQKHRSDNLSKNIAVESKELQDKPQIDRILTVQNQLESLTSLHSQKYAASRIFDYLNSVTPSNV